MTGDQAPGIRHRIAEALLQAVRASGVDGDVPDLELGRAKSPERGEYASPAGLKLARVLRRPPAEIADRLARSIAVEEDAATAEAVDGYVNFKLTTRWLQ